jgi:hypothetical protein
MTAGMLMKQRLLWSFAISLTITVLAAGIASFTHWSAVGTVLAPGIFAAALIFPEGVHSDSFYTYLFLTGILNVFVLTLPILLLWNWIGPSRQTGSNRVVERTDVGRKSLQTGVTHMAAPSPAKTSHVFAASRWTRGNRIFPTRIEVGPDHVVRIRRKLFGRTEESIAVSKVASVQITTGLIWSNIRIDSSGGTDPIVSHGHSKGDAVRIRELIEEFQRA